MRDYLHGKNRQQFFFSMIELLASQSVTVHVSITDDSCGTASRKSENAADDALILALERFDRNCLNRKKTAVVQVDQSSGGSRDDKKFLKRLRTLVDEGTDYSGLTTIAPVFGSCVSHLNRMIQVADFITSCTLARFAGESQNSPPVFEKMIPLFFKEEDRIGNIGVKMHPSYRYGNLYHWILHDPIYRTPSTGSPLPLKSMIYYYDEHEPKRLT